MNCQDGCKFLISRTRNGEEEVFCRLIPAQRCLGVSKCSEWEPIPPKVKDDEPRPDKRR